MQAWDRGNAAEERQAKEQARREVMQKQLEAADLRLENGEGAVRLQYGHVPRVCTISLHGHIIGTMLCMTVASH